MPGSKRNSVVGLMTRSLSPVPSFMSFEACLEHFWAIIRSAQDAQKSASDPDIRGISQKWKARSKLSPKDGGLRKKFFEYLIRYGPDVESPEKRAELLKELKDRWSFDGFAHETGEGRKGHVMCRGIVHLTPTIAAYVDIKLYDEPIGYIYVVRNESSIEAYKRRDDGPEGRSLETCPRPELALCKVGMTGLQSSSTIYINNDGRLIMRPVPPHMRWHDKDDYAVDQGWDLPSAPPKKGKPSPLLKDVFTFFQENISTDEGRNVICVIPRPSKTTSTSGSQVKQLEETLRNLIGSPVTTDDDTETIIVFQSVIQKLRALMLESLGGGKFPSLGEVVKTLTRGPMEFVPGVGVGVRNKGTLIHQSIIMLRAPSIGLQYWDREQMGLSSAVARIRQECSFVEDDERDAVGNAIPRFVSPVSLMSRYSRIAGTSSGGGSGAISSLESVSLDDSGAREKK